MSDAPRSTYEPSPLHVYHQATIIVRFLALDCFSCQARYAPDYSLIPLHDHGQAAARLRKVEGPHEADYRAVLYEIAGRSPSSELTESVFLKDADSLGWRKITMYGKTVYICPLCREHKRTRPEWERRLV